MKKSRRTFIKTTVKAGTALAVVPGLNFSQEKAPEIEVVNPRNRVPVSLIIDDYNI